MSSSGSPKFLIVGVGAIGSAYLAFLSKSGYQAVGLVKKNKKIEKIRVEGIWGEFETPVRTVDSVDKLPFTPDIIIISVKSYDTERALESVKSIVGENTYLMIAQNGYGNYEKAVERFGEGKVILSRIIFGSKVL
ncbi:ketopantoate reductase family protein, partial [Aquifex sp.]